MKVEVLPSLVPKSNVSLSIYSSFIHSSLTSTSDLTIVYSKSFIVFKFSEKNNVTNKKGRCSAMAQRVTANTTLSDSMPSQENEVFSFPHYGSKTKRSVKFPHNM